MPTDLTIVCPGVPGAVTRAFEALGRAGVGITGYAGVKHVLHVVVDDAAARAPVEAEGIEVEAERKVILSAVESGAEAVGEALRRITDAGIGLELLYVTTYGRAVIGAGDLEGARAALDAGKMSR